MCIFILLIISCDLAIFSDRVILLTLQLFTILLKLNRKQIEVHLMAKLLWSIQVNHTYCLYNRVYCWTSHLIFSLHYYGFVYFHVEYYNRQYWILLIDYLHWVLSFFLECAKQQLPLKGELMQTEDRYRKSVIWNTKQKEHKEYRVNFQD